jgi:hypothetical protein
MVTRPSFMSRMSFSKKVEIFLLSGLGFSFFCLGVIAAFIIIDFIALVTHITRITRYLGMLIPTIIMSALVLLLIDNFTYTVFTFGISTSTGLARGAYGLLCMLLSIYIYFQMLNFFGLRGKSSSKEQTLHRLLFVSVVILVITFGLALAKMDFSKILPTQTAAETQHVERLPNILLLGSDGLNAVNLSAYGYYRDTTPRLVELAQSSLVAENAFTNAGNTAGSVISIMTSKLPTQTRVLYPPDILTGINSFQHLPGILKSLGYKTVEYGVPYYIDAYNFNFQDGFDIVNNRTINVGMLGELGRKLGHDNEVYFLSRLTWRISDRILHIFFIREMQNPFDIVTQPAPSISDQDKIDQLLYQLDKSDTPVFIHAHLLGTHGGIYSPLIRVFSIGESQAQPWMRDFYADTILGFDSYVGEVVDHLKANGQFDNTILIIYTDHNKMFKVNERIPLIIHFPGGERAGRITKNVENLDIAPTILDYLGLPKPEWMGGESILTTNLSDQRLIFSAGTINVKLNEQNVVLLDPVQNQPPFYQFNYLNVIGCQKWYSFDLTTFIWLSGDVFGYVAPCNSKDLLSADEIKQAVYQRLVLDGFAISSLP